jgi:peptide-methionine (S)-S-oxide reductase
VVTQVVEATPFTAAEPEHQNYYNLNANAPYCRAVIAPKLRKISIPPELLREP